MKKSIILVSFLFFTFSAKAQVPTFNKTYHIQTDGLFNVLELSDGYLAGIIASTFPLNYQHLIISKTDFYGNIQWQKIYNDTTQYYINYALIRTSDNCFITGAFLYNNITNRVSVSLMKLDSLGDSIWTNNVYAPLGFNFNSGYVIETSDKGFLVSGQRVDSLSNDGDGAIIKTDSLGNEQWHRIYGGPFFDALISSAQLPDDSYLSLGWTRSFGFGSNTNRDIYLVKTDSAGNFLWQKTFGTIAFETATGITALSDGNFALACFEETGSGGDGTIFKIDSAGNVIWHAAYAPAHLTEFWWVRERYDKTLIVTGAVTPSQGSSDRGILLKADSAGNFLWKRDFIVNNDYSYFRDVQCTADGGYISAGFVFTGASGGQDAWLVKLDSLGCDSAGCPTPLTALPPSLSGANNEIVKVFPNPAKEKITLSFSRSLFSGAQIKIFNLLGKEVYRQPAFIQKHISLPVYQLPPGVYVVEISHEGIKERVKFVKE